MKNLIFISASFFAIFIVFILTKKNKRISDYTLILLNIICAALVISYIFIESNISPQVFFWQNILPFWLFTVFMVYAMQMIYNETWRTYYWIFFPFSVLFTLYQIYDVFIAHESFAVIVDERFLTPPLIYHVFFKGSMIFTIILSFWLLRKLKNYAFELKETYSFIEGMRLKWLKHYAVGLIVINCFTLVSFLSFNFGFIKNIENIYFVLNLIFVILFFYLSFHGVRHYSLENFPIHKQGIDSKTAVTSLSEAKPKPGSMRIAAEKQDLVFVQLERLFESTRIFTQPQLKIAEVADHLDIPSHQLSQIINSKYGKPFYDFVAAHRINLLKKKLLSPESKQFTILSLGLDCGFNSKASLNRVFKEHTGVTPSQFQKSHLTK